MSNNPNIPLDINTSPTTNQTDPIENIDESSSINTPFDPKDIDITSKPMSLDNVIKRLQYGEINIYTEFQRHPDLWKAKQQSRLIESILLRLPLPAFYFDATNNNKWDVIDGLQRISTIKNFIVEQENALKLTNLEYLTKFNGCTFKELPRDLQRRIEETEIIAYLINARTPIEVKFNIFKRLNTGGLKLTTQEIRHALNQGIAADYVKELAELDEFITATGGTIPSERMKDRDFTNRFLAFYTQPYKDYKPDLDSFLTKSMSLLPKLSSRQRIEIKNAFIVAMVTAKAIWGDYAFRKRYDKTENRKNPINKALFDSLSVNLAKLSDEERSRLIHSKELVVDEFIAIMSDTDFMKAITSSTGDKKAVYTRFNTIEKLIQKILHT